MQPPQSRHSRFYGGAATSVTVGAAFEIGTIRSHAFERERWALTGIVIAAGLLRAFKLTAFALWFDESASITISQYPWSSLISHVEQDIGPPLYFVVLKGWTSLFGYSIVSLRSLSLVFELLAVWACYAFVKTAFRRDRVALLAALFFAVNPFQIQYSRETRMYAMGVCLVLVTSWLLARAIRSGRILHWVEYGVAVAGCFYTHYYLAFSIVAQAVVALYWCIRIQGETETPITFAGRLVRACIGYGIALAAFIPWIPAFLRQNDRVQQDFWVPPLTVIEVLRIPWTVMLGGSDSGWTPVAWLTVAAVGLVLAAVLAIRRASSRVEWLVVLQAITPIVFGLALSLNRPIFVDRYFLFASAFWSILVAMIVGGMRPAWGRRAVAIAIVLISVMGLMKNLNAIGLVSLRHPSDRPGMAGAATLVNDRVENGDAIIVAHSLVYFPFKYYNRTSVHPRLYAQRVLDIPVYAGRAMLEPDDLIENLASVSGPRRVWFLWTDGFYQHKPTTPAAWHLKDTRQFNDTIGFKGAIYVDLYEVD